MPGIPMPFLFAAWGWPVCRSAAVPSFDLLNRCTLHEFQDMLGNFQFCLIQNILNAGILSMRIAVAVVRKSDS